MNKTFFVVNWQVSEGGWGCADFEAEIYKTEKEASERVYILNKEKKEHCGYYFEWFPAKMIA